VGGGAAGIIAAWRAATQGAKVVLLEKTPRLGTKILISGGGKCNITHDGPLEDVLKAFRPNEARFIRPACYRFTNVEIVEMLTSRGLQVYTRPDGRIFPVDKSAKEVVGILQGYLADAGVEIHLNTPVQGLLSENGSVYGVRLADGELKCARVVVSVGGSSYPNSGTTGDGWKWARELGHSIVKVQAALSPIYLQEPDASRSGVSVRDCVLKARLDGKEIARWRGDLLFTHLGVSGPTVLGISRVVAENERKGEITLEADLAPDKTFEELSSETLQFTQSNLRRALGSYVEQFVASRLASDLLKDAGVAESVVGAQLGKKGRNRLVETLKAWELGVVRTVSLEKGEVVAGGISLDEVDPQTMESKKVKGLYLCGEVLDIAGPVGGYNLQAAFATGFVAGESAVRNI
jgi:predicted Rossmann fold flavoprotein